jgi:glycosyltransferase involved in cell wall biosynthesis
MKEAIQSVVNQQVDGPWEILLILDRPSVECIKILEECLTEKFRVVDSRKPGVANAHNLGISKAKYDLIAVMHSDDVMMPGRLKLQNDILRENETIACVGGQVELIDKDGRVLGKSSYPLDSGRIQKVMARVCCISHPTTMYRRQIALQAGGYDESFSPVEDYDFWLTLLRDGRIVNLREPVLKYRIHANQLSQKQLSVQTTKKIEVLRKHFPKEFVRSSDVRREKVFNVYLHKANSMKTSGARTRFVFCIFLLVWIHPKILLLLALSRIELKRRNV